MSHQCAENCAIHKVRHKPTSPAQVMSVNVGLLLAAFCLLLACPVRAATEVAWYMTAQGTDDRLTKQSDLQFGSDYPSNVTVQIDRWVFG